MTNEILGFKDKYEFLSNDFPCSIYIPWDDLTYNNASTALIAQKIEDRGSRRKFARLNGVKARKKESSIPENSEWLKNKDKLLFDILMVKFKSTELKKKLLETGNKKLINVTTYPDPYYGIRDGYGKNKLGEILEKVRDSLKSA